MPELDCHWKLTQARTARDFAKLAEDILTTTAKQVQKLAKLEVFLKNQDQRPPSTQEPQKEVDNLTKKQKELCRNDAKKEEWREHILEIQTLQKEVMSLTEKMEGVHRHAIWCSICDKTAISPVMVRRHSARKEILVCNLCARSVEASGGVEIREEQGLNNIASALWTDLLHGSCPTGT